MKNDKVLSSLGLAMRAGYIASGEYAVIQAVREGLAQLVIVAGDASENTKKKMKDKTAYYGVPLCYYGTQEKLGHSIGKQTRASIAVLDHGFAASIQKHIAIADQEKGEGCQI